MNVTKTVVYKLGALQGTATIDLVRNEIEGNVTTLASRLGLTARPIQEWELVRVPAQLMLHVGFSKSRSASPFSVSDAYTHVNTLFGPRAEFAVESDCTFKLILPCPEIRKKKNVWLAVAAVLLVLFAALLLWLRQWLVRH
jgi:hypothetical protein